MKTRLFVGLLTLGCLIPCQRLSAADTPPESLLPADTVFFLRLESWNDLRQTANETVLGELMRGDMGNFLRSTADWGWASGRETLKQSLPDEPRRLDAFWDNLEKSGQQILRHGALLAVQPGADGQPSLFMFVFPSGSKDGGVGAVQKFLEDSVGPDSGHKPPEKVCIGIDGQTISVVDFGERGAWAWWSEEGHFVVAAMSGSGEALAERLSWTATCRAFGVDLTENEFYGKLAASQNYATLLSGFVDVAAIRGPRAPAEDEDEQTFLLEDWGMCDVQGLTFSCGFQGKAWRESYALHLDPRRRGLWQVLNAAEKVDVEQLPAMPADATNVFIGAFDAGRLVDLAGKTIDVLEPAKDDKEGEARTAIMKGMVKQMVQHLGSQVVWFNSPCEGAFLIDQTVAVQVKDASALNALVWLAYTGQQIKGFFPKDDDSQDFLLGLKLQKHTYRGVDYWTVDYPTSSEVSLSLTFVIHDGWLVMGCQPQIVQGYILRTRNEAPCWEPSAELQEALRSAAREGKLQKGARSRRILAVSQIETRELTRMGMSWAPWMAMYAGLGNTSLEKAGLPPLDVTMIPNTHTVLGPLFPNVNMFIDDGEALRWEKHASLPIGNALTTYFGVSACFMMLVDGESVPSLSVWIPEARPTVADKVSRPAPAPEPAPGVSQQQIVEMTQKGSSPSVIMNAINASDSTYRLSNDDVTYLRQQGVDCSVIEYMLTRSPRSAPPQAAGAPDAPKSTPSSWWNLDPEATKSATSPAMPIGTSPPVSSTPGIANNFQPIPAPLPGAAKAGDVVQISGQNLPTTASPKSETLVVKVYDVTGLLDVKNLERSKTELQNALYLVAPKDWEEGREAGSLPIVFLTSQERMIVRQTPQAHQRIEALLTELKASLAKDQPKQVTPTINPSGMYQSGYGIYGR